MPLTLTRRFTFSAAHRYRRPEWDDARNAAVFGKCARPQYHGHTYVCDVSVGGPVSAETGFCADLGVLDAAIAVLREQLDHANLNTDIPEFADGRLIPTTEELARWIAERVQARLTDGTLVERVVVAEEPTLWATWSRT
ncbi:MAG: 6-carboxytetrahydropterin synthase [Gemmatimonadaceae bacterium]|nr:6-carboxytetrahydropterin synthase [Gemmatimonadaceae bacterium]